jgi:hypothetical protein
LAAVWSPQGFEAFRCSPTSSRPGHRPVGEERAWGRRLAKRFGVDSHYDEKSFQVKNQPSGSGFFDRDTLTPESLDEQVVALFKVARQSKGDCLVAYGWAMAEDLVKLGAS